MNKFTNNPMSEHLYDRYKHVDLMEEDIVDQLLKEYDNCICEGLDGDYLVFKTFMLMDENTDLPYIDTQILKFNCFTGEPID